MNEEIENAANIPFKVTALIGINRRNPLAEVGYWQERTLSEDIFFNKFLTFAEQLFNTKKLYIESILDTNPPSYKLQKKLFGNYSIFLTFGGKLQVIKVLNNQDIPYLKVSYKLHENLFNNNSTVNSEFVNENNSEPIQTEKPDYNTLKYLLPKLQTLFDEIANEKTQEIRDKTVNPDEYLPNGYIKIELMPKKENILQNSKQRQARRALAELPVPYEVSALIGDYSYGKPNNTIAALREFKKTPLPSMLETKHIYGASPEFVPLETQKKVAEIRRKQERNHRMKTIRNQAAATKNQPVATNTNLAKYNRKWYQIWKPKTQKRTSNNVKIPNWGATQPPQKPWYKKLFGGKTRRALKKGRMTRGRKRV